MGNLYCKLDEDTWISVDGTEEFSWTSLLYIFIGIIVVGVCIGLGIGFLELLLSLFD